MRHLEEDPTIMDPQSRAIKIVDNLPSPDDFKEHRQPNFADPELLIETVANLCITRTVTTPRAVDALGDQFAAVSEGRAKTPILVVEGCHENVLRVDQPVDPLVNKTKVTRRVVAASALGGAITLHRNKGANGKPRTDLVQISKDGTPVTPHMGDAVNGEKIEERTPDPRRHMSAAVQAYDLEMALQEEYGGLHIPSAREALLLTYDSPFIRHDPLTGRDYMLSVDVPWVGVRTGKPGGAHSRLVKGIENPIGNKVGPDTTPDDIVEWAEIVNPDEVPGKHLLMFRLGLHNIHKLRALAKVVKSNAKGALLLWDIHGDDEIVNGRKIRSVNTIIRSIGYTARVFHEEGLTLDGLSLETMTDGSRFEVVNRRGQKPRHKGNLDSQLNPKQTLKVLNASAPYLLQAA